MTTHPDLSPLTPYWQDASLLQTDPPADLWPRIESARSRQLRRRLHMRNFAGFVSVGFAVVALFVGGRWPATPLRNDDTVDWQARAQVLELHLAAFDQNHNAQAGTGAFDIEAELGEIDRRLQTTYESKSADPVRYTNELAPLWKRRSELLNALILARRQGLAVTRI
jgi:hypothetical protein